MLRKDIKYHQVLARVHAAFFEIFFLNNEGYAFVSLEKAPFVLGHAEAVIAST